MENNNLYKIDTKKAESIGAKEDFCKYWSIARKVLLIIEKLVDDPKAKEAIEKLIKAGDDAASIICNTIKS